MTDNNHQASSGNLRRVGIFGGTFNPLHLGHVQTVAQLLTQFQLDLVRYIPAAEPPHRAVPGVSANRRLDMVRLAIEDQPRMIADSRELERQGPSYTFDTVLSLQAEFPDDRFFLVLGLDALLGIESWYRWQQLLDLVNIIVMVRPGWQIPGELPRWWQQRQADTDQFQATSAGKICVAQVEPVDISSTRIRQRLKQGQSARQWLHPAVSQYIQDHKLYE